MGRQWAGSEQGIPLFVSFSRTKLTFTIQHCGCRYSDGTESCFQVHDDECITEVFVKYGQWIDGLQFKTSNGNVYQYANIIGGNLANITADPGECLRSLNVYAGPRNANGDVGVLRIRILFAGICIC